MTRTLRVASFAVAIAAAVVMLAPERAHAADITDVLDAFDEHVIDGKVIPDYFDFSIEPTFVQTLERAKITREVNCIGDAARCPDEATIISNKELRYERLINQMDLDFRIGIYKDLEFSITLPIVFSDERNLKYARNAGAACEFNENPDNPKCVNETNSTLDPSDARIQADADDGGPFSTYRYFDLKSPDAGEGEGQQTASPSRSGLADIKFRLSWAPFNEERYVDTVNEVWGRNHGRSALKLAVQYTAPTAAIATNERDNEDVGRGLHSLQFDIATSRRYEYVDPYVGFRFGFHVPADETNFKNYGTGQERVAPGPWGDVTVGVEFIPWENVTEQWQQYFRIGLEGVFGYVGEGREYSPLFDAMGTSDCQGLSLNDIATRPECGWMAEKWANAGFNNVAAIDPLNGSYNRDAPLRDDGMMSYEGYGYYGGKLKFSVMPIQYVKIDAGIGLITQQEHFISFAKAGEDLRGRVDNPDGTMSTVPSDTVGKDGTVSFDDIKERNPVYNPTLDAIGKRLRQEETTIFQWNIGLSFMF